MSLRSKWCGPILSTKWRNVSLTAAVVRCLMKAGDTHKNYIKSSDDKDQNDESEELL